MNTIEQLRAQIRHLERDIEDKQGEICTAQSNIETFEYAASESEFDEFLDEDRVFSCDLWYGIFPK